MNNKLFYTMIYVFLLAVGLGHGAAQFRESTSAPALPDQHVIRQQLAEMIQQAIKQSTFSMPGRAKVTTTPLLSTDDYDKAKRFGDGATTILAEYLTSKQFFEQLLAIRLLAHIGTEASKDVLDEFAEKAQLIATRSYALDFVAANGRQKDTALLKKIASTDPDTHVRTRAIDVLERHNKENNP